MTWTLAYATLKLTVLQDTTPNLFKLFSINNVL